MEDNRGQRAGFQVGYRPTDDTFVFLHGQRLLAWVRRDRWAGLVDWMAGDCEAANYGPMTVMRWPVADHCRVLVCLGDPDKRDAVIVLAAELSDWVAIVGELRRFGDEMEARARMWEPMGWSEVQGWQGPGFSTS